MGRLEFTKTEEYTYDGIAALLLIKTEPEMAAEVAEKVARKNDEEVVPGGFRVLGVRWVAMINTEKDSERIADLIASLMVMSQEDLDRWIEEIRDIPGVLNPTPLTVGKYFKSMRGHNSLP
ncbi:MAG: hypothetical protein H8E90_06880 [Anaerolineales bacterium]|nr:hypothetical protein [Anaerolineales bacterium]